MFHLLLILSLLIFGIALIALFAFLAMLAVCAIAASVVGGTSVAIFVKNKAVKKLLFIGFSIVFLIGASCLMPALVAFADLNGIVFWILIDLFGLLLLISCGIGMKAAGNVKSKGVRITLTVIFILLIVLTVIIWAAINMYCFGVASVRLHPNH